MSDKAYSSFGSQSKTRLEEFRNEVLNYIKKNGWISEYKMHQLFCPDHGSRYKGYSDLEGLEITKDPNDPKKYRWVITKEPTKRPKKVSK